MHSDTAGRRRTGSDRCGEHAPAWAGRLRAAESGSTRELCVLRPPDPTATVAVVPDPGAAVDRARRLDVRDRAPAPALICEDRAAAEDCVVVVEVP